jgi:multimeric flavodoxin WrbA
VASILEGATARGAATDKIYLKGLTLQECDGCHACWQGKECAKKDDMNQLYSRVMESDVMVFGTPVYWYGPTALMKAFIDRFVYFNCPENRGRIAGKSAVIAIPFEDEDLETASLLVSFFEKCFDYLEMKLVGQTLGPGVTEKGEIAHKAESLQQAHQLGMRLT